jgi:NAD(P)-dependent dehydrogenase (short-subunit alcohol dehydrogenase family)
VALSLDFANQAAVVTGGASGIGEATARLLTAAGAHVTIIDREAPRNPALPFVRADVTDPDALTSVFRELAPAIVVANAGTATEAPLTETSRADWDRVIAVNLSGVFHTIKAAAQVMQPRRSGAIVITASTNSFDGEANLIAYNASKVGLLGLLHTAANELGPFGIRVNAVCPGMIRTPLSRRQFEDPAFLRPYFQHVALGRGGEAEEVAHAIAFLASNFASYITGVTLLVDGGQMASKFGTWNETSAIFTDDRWRLR